MQKQNIRIALIGMLATLGVSCGLVGCSQHTTEKPATGYPGGQKSGAVNNSTSDPAYAEKISRRPHGGGSSATNAPGYPGSGGR